MAVAAVDLSGPVAQIVLIASGLGAVTFIGQWLFRHVVRPLWRFYKWVRHELRDEIERRHKIDEIISRELTHNGGSSMKDHTTYGAQAIGALSADLEEVKGSQETIFELLDAIVDTKGAEHEEMWEALLALGAERRQKPRRASDKKAGGLT